MHIVQRLQEVCGEHLLREKVLVVPSLAIGHQIADAVAFRGTRWVNLRMETVRTMSDAVAGFDLAQRGITVLSRAQALAIIERACDRVLDPSSYFGALIGQPGLYRAIQRSIDDLRHAGIETLPQDSFEDPLKARDLATVIAAYEEELGAQRFTDRYGVIARAIELLESSAPRPWSEDALWFALDDLELTSAEEKLLNLCSRRLQPAEEDDVRRLKPAATQKQAFFIRAAGEENELRGAFRSILRDRATLDQCEVIYTTRDPYLSLSYELTAEYDIPATFAEGIAASFTRPGQAAIGFLQWIASDFESTHLQRIARAGAIRTGEGIAPSPFARVLREAKIGWGRERYAPRLEAFADAAQRKLDLIDSDVRRENMQRELGRRQSALAVANDMISIAGQRGLAESTRRFLDQFAAVKNEIDAMAAVAVRGLLRDLAAIEPALEPPYSRFAIDRLIEAIRSTHVAASNPRPGHLHIAPVRAGGWSGRSRLFLAGLDDAKHPGAGLQDPIVLDEERSSLNRTTSRHLELLGNTPARNSGRLQSLLARVPHATITVSYSDLDLRERRAHFPSKDVLDVFRSAHASAKATYDDLVRAATPAGFLEDQAPLSETEWWLAQRFIRARSDLRDQLFIAHPWIAAGESARSMRDSDAITAWDGKIDITPDRIDPRLTGNVISASQMERMAKCPFGWFVERLLGIAPIEELTREQDQWLDPRDFGSLVHEVLETTMLEICDAGQQPSLARHLARMHEIASEAAEEWRREVPPASETAFLRQRDELLNVCEVFLRTEQSRCDEVVPKYFEAPFGMSDANGSPIGIAGPLVIPLGNGREVRLRGKIDRVDQVVRTGGWQVWDYKTGTLYEYQRAWRLNKGRKLQHVIYTLALEQMLREHKLAGSVECAGYYFPTAKGGGERNVRDCAPGELEHALNLLFDVIGSGWFPLPDEGKCDFCEFQSICGAPHIAAARMTRKQTANADDPAVRAWRALQEVK